MESSPLQTYQMEQEPPADEDDEVGASSRWDNHPGRRRVLSRLQGFLFLESRQSSSRMSSSVVIPDLLLNIKVWIAGNFIVGWLAMIFQVTALIVDARLSHMGGGLWCGLIFVVTAAFSWRLLQVQGVGNTIASFTLMMSIMSFVMGVLLLGIQAADIDHLHKNWDIYCSGSSTNCSAMLGLESVLLVCGILATFPINFFLFLTVVKMYQPRPSPRPVVPPAPTDEAVSTNPPEGNQQEPSNPDPSVPSSTSP